MTGRAGRVVRIGEGAEVQQATLAGALPGSDGNRTGGATKEHPRPFTRQLIDVALRTLRVGRRIALQQFQRAPQHATGLIDFLHCQQRTAHLHQALLGVLAGSWQVHTKGDGIGSKSEAAPAKHQRQQQAAGQAGDN